MKKTVVLMLVLFLLLNLTMQSVSATEYICVYGTVSGEPEDITVLALDKNTYSGELTPESIRYVNQVTPASNGNFRLVLPLGNNDDLIIRSNKNITTQKESVNGSVYISVNGDDGNDGMTENTPLATLEAAYAQLFHIDEIILMDSIAYKEPPKHTEKLTIRGYSSNVILSLPDEVSLEGDLEIDNVVLNNASTIYANGHNLKITETVGSTATLSNGRLTVYGGKKFVDLEGDTNLILLGGKYLEVFGGGRGGTVSGNTNVILGGNANAGEGIDDQKDSTYSPCYVYGGGNESSVTGKINVILDGNAIARYLIGAGKGTAGTAVDTNIMINGGKVMNVYGGSLEAELVNCDTHITMTGGLAEALFGGSYSQQLTGNTYITITGGNVSRRVYTGCYNGVGFTWDGSYHVIGTTTLAIGPNAQLVTYTELDSSNKLDCGIYIGSRVSQNFAEEANTLIYLDNCYNTQKSKIGCIINGGIQPLNSWHDYVVKASAGGVVRGTQTGGIVRIIPDTGYIGEIDGVTYETDGVVNLKSGTVNSVVFTAKPYNINSLTAAKSDKAVVGSASIMGSDIEIGPTLWIAVYEENPRKLVSCTMQDASTSGTKEFNLSCTFEEGKKYIIKAFLWNDGLKFLSMDYKLDLN